VSRARTKRPGTSRGAGKARAPSQATDPYEKVDEELVLDELPELRVLQVAIYESTPLLPSAQAAVEACGHDVAIGAVGRDGLELIKEALREGDLDVLLVGVPGGEAVIDAALALAPRRPVVIAACGGSAVNAARAAAAAGADLVTLRPHDAERLAPMLLAAGRLVEARRELANVKGSEAVLRQKLDAFTDPDRSGLQPFELFSNVLELELKRARRQDYALSIGLFALELPPPAPPPGVRGILRARAGNALVNAIRDIDMATELDHERLLVLLPHTDREGAVQVAQRITAAVMAGDPVVAGGRTFPPRLIGGVATVAPGQDTSVPKLMRDAQRALEQARHDGSDVAVPIFVEGEEDA